MRINSCFKNCGVLEIDKTKLLKNKCRFRILSSLKFRAQTLIESLCLFNGASVERTILCQFSYTYVVTRVVL